MLETLLSLAILFGLASIPVEPQDGPTTMNIDNGGPLPTCNPATMKCP